MTGRLEDATLAERASLTSGETFWRTQSIGRLGIRGLLLADGPHGIRRQPDEHNFGIGESLLATCFPPAVALASTFDTHLVRCVGAAIGREARTLEVDVVLGPGLNLKRSPLGGRNFEYYSEDPWLSGRLAAAMVEGIQSEGVAACAKHFAVNNQETDRLRVSAEVDERTLRELYLRSFEHVVRSARPWMVMCAYNGVNGVPASSNRWLLDTVLRQEWGFDGVVVSDWGAVGDPVAALAAGLDLQMPATGGRSDAVVVRAVEEGRLAAEVVDRSAARVLRLVDRVDTGPVPVADPDAHHRLAREAAGRGIVLLKNDGGLLPLDGSGSIAVIGALAVRPRIQGGGSSRVNPTRVDELVGALRQRLAPSRVDFAAGYPDRPGDEQAGLIGEAVALARRAGTTIVVLGLPEDAEAEGVDRTTLSLPAEQLALVDAVVAATARVAVVLVGGGVIDVGPFDDRVPAIVAGWLLGQAGGAALCDILTGDVTPSGRLPETIPMRLEDSPSALHFPGDSGTVRYGEGLFVGYRGHDALGQPVRYPFGHGLSYTRFGYSDLEVLVTRQGVRVELLVENVGERRGREVVQLYVGVAGSAVTRPRRELKGVAIVDLEPGARRSTSVEVPWQELRYWDVAARRWVLESGPYEFAVGASSRDLRLAATVEIVGDEDRAQLTTESTLGELLADPAVRERLHAVVSERMGADAAEHVVGRSGWATMMASFPFARVAAWPGLDLSDDDVNRVVYGTAEGVPGRT
ncbi:MAG: beta-glucosidase [Propionicimonas sp.]